MIDFGKGYVCLRNLGNVLIKVLCYLKKKNVGKVLTLIAFYIVLAKQW